MFGKPTYTYNQYTSYPGSPGLSSVSSNSSSCSASTLSSLTNLQDINQELGQSVLNSVYNQMSTNNLANGNSGNMSDGSSYTQMKNGLSTNGVPANGVVNDPSSNLALTHAMSEYLNHYVLFILHETFFAIKYLTPEI